MEPIVIKFAPNNQFSDNELFDFCAANDGLRIERNKQNELVIMSPSGSLTSNILMRINRELLNWLDKNSDAGYLFESSAGFRLSDGSVLSADAAFIIKEKWEALSREQQEKFAPICPDFIIEVRSPSDSVLQLTEKIQDWIRNGCRLAWLIDPIKKNAWVYTPKGLIKSALTFQDSLDGMDVLPGLKFELKSLE